MGCASFFFKTLLTGSNSTLKSGAALFSVDDVTDESIDDFLRGYIGLYSSQYHLQALAAF